MTSNNLVYLNTFCLNLFSLLNLVFVFLVDRAKLLQKSEMRKDIVIELSYRGFSRASDYS